MHIKIPESVGQGASFNGQVVLVAGAGSADSGLSIGKATALLFAHYGASVVALDVDEALAKDTANNIEALGGQALAVQGDVSDRHAMEAAVQAAVDQFGGIDAYIANVGIGKMGGVMQTSSNDLTRIHQLNLDSLLIGSQLIIPLMKQRGGGAIVTLSSVAGLQYLGYPHLAYSVTKAGLIHFTRMIAQEYANEGIRANTVVPGLINTPRVQKNIGQAFSASGSRTEVTRKRDAQVPMGRMGTAWEIAQAVVFLASSQASYITGTELVVDGGITGRFASVDASGNT